MSATAGSKESAPAGARVALANEHTVAVVDPAAGGRVQHLVDFASGRELLYQRNAGDSGAAFLEASTGGWDELFPNDSPVGSYPDHGVIWNTPFAVTAFEPRTELRMTATLFEPQVRINRIYRLLDPPRRGLRLETELVAGEVDPGPWLWSSHPMLSVAPGWTIVVTGNELRSDRQRPGRFQAGITLSDRDQRLAAVVPSRGQQLEEVLYLNAASKVTVRSPVGEQTTRVAWDAGRLPYAWIVTVVATAGIDLCLVVEPSTSSGYDLNENPDRLEQLTPGTPVQFAVEVESLDGISAE